MAHLCRTCQSTDFTVENYERVCISCGEVQEDMSGDEGQLQMLSDHQTVLDNIGSKNFDMSARLTNRVRGEGQSPDDRRKISKAKILDEMRKIVKQLVKEPRALNEIMDLMTLTFQGYQKRMLTSKRNGLAGACIYYLSAKHQLGISLSDICKMLDIKMKVINVCLKEVKRLCPDFEYERPNIRDLVRKFVDRIASINYNPTMDTSAPGYNANTSAFSPQAIRKNQALIDHKDKLVLQDRVMLLLDLFEAMHPYKQPSPQSLITAVIYHAWKSLDTFKAIASNLKRSIDDLKRSESPTEALIVAEPDYKCNQKDTVAKHSMGYERFCELCNLKYSSNGHKIVTKLQSSLLMLGRHLGDVNKLNLPWYLKDIIENSPHLIQEHMRNEPTVSTQDSDLKTSSQIKCMK